MPKKRRNAFSARKYAAIMFTDIVGYTALMGSDEDRAFEMLSNNREIHQQLTEKYNGTLIKEIGDGMLISFDLASDAVYCAIEIQKNCKKQNIPLRIGIHEGEIVIQGTDVLGDVVNVSSRLEADTQKGCITISGKVYSDIKNRSNIQTKYIKEKRFKNVDEPIKVYEVICEEIDDRSKSIKKSKRKINRRSVIVIFGFLAVMGAGFIVWKFLPQNNAPELDKSIAVLPFDYLSQDSDKQYLADGVMDAITSNLAKISELKVVAKTSVEKYKEQSIDVREIGKELDVSYIVEGSFQLVGGHARLIVQLINTIDGTHVWSNKYDREWADIFKVQSEVSQKIASEVKVAITPEIQKVIEDEPTVNLTAYDYYLRGRDFATRSDNQDDINHALNLFEKAVQIDSNFTLAWVGLARNSSRLIYYGANYDSTISNVEYYLNKAKSIDARSVEVRREEGRYYYSVKQNYDKALKILNEVDHQHPNDDETVSIIGYMLRMKGEVSNSIEYLKRAVTLNPISHEHWNELGETYKMHKDYINAEKCFLKALELNAANHNTYERILALYRVTCNFKKANNFINNYKERFSKSDAQNVKFFISQIYLLQGEFEKSIAILNTIPDKFEDITIPFFKYCFLGFYYYGTAKHQNANHYLSIAKKYYEEYLHIKNTFRWDVVYAEVLAGLGLHDSAFEVINDALDKVNYKENYFFGYHTEISYIRVLVLSSNNEEAIKRLAGVVQKDGRISVEELKLDPFWNPIRDMEGFKEIVNNPAYRVKL